MYKKVSTSLIGVALLASVLSGCGGSGSNSVDDEPVVGQARPNSGDLDSETPGAPGSTDSTDTSGGDIPTLIIPNGGTDGVETGSDESSNPGGAGEGSTGNGNDVVLDPADAKDSVSKKIPDGLVLGDPVVTPSAVDPFSKFQLGDVLYTNNVYDGRQLDASNNWQLIFYNGVQDFVSWVVPALIGNNADPCARPQWEEPVTLNYRLTSRKDSPTERDTFVRAYPAMVVGTMGGRYESWGVECGKTESISTTAKRHGGSPVYEMQTVAAATGLPVLAGELDYDIEVSVKADLESDTAVNGIANIFMDSYWHNVSDSSIVPGGNQDFVNNVNGISSDYTEVWNLNIWFDYPRFRGNASQWTGGRKIGSITLEQGGLFDVYFKIEGSRDGHMPRCRLGTEENCFLYIGLVATDSDASRNGITVNYTEIADWMMSADFRDLFLNGAFETETPAARAYEAWRTIDGDANDTNPDPAKRGPRFPDKNHVVGGIHLGSELWYNPDAEAASIVFDALGVAVEGKGEFGRFVRY